MNILKNYTMMALLMSSLAFSCAKEEPKPEPKKECETKNYGTVTISNNSENPYDIYIDNVHKIKLAGKTVSAKINVTEGNGRKLFARQASGYLITPTEKTASLNVIACSDYSWQIP